MSANHLNSDNMHIKVVRCHSYLKALEPSKGKK